MCLLMRGTISLLISALLTIIFAASSAAIPLPFQITWDRNAEADLAFYTIYYGTSSGNYNHFADVDKEYPSFSFHEDLLTRNNISVGPEGVTLYIALTATDYSLNQSSYSTEVTVFLEQSTTTTTTPATTTAPTLTTTSTPPNQQGFCSTETPLILTGAVPEEGTLEVTITDNPAHAVSASLILDLYDPDMAREGYIYINGNGPIALPSGDYDGQVHSFEVPINADWLVQGDNSFRFTHVDTLGYEVRNVCVHLSSLAPNQIETCSADSPLILTGAIPEEGTMNVNATGDPASAVSASVTLTLYDPDIQGEGYIYINDNGPIDLPVGDYDGLERTFELPVNADWLVQGDNSFRFTHVDTWGYQVRELCLKIVYSDSPPTTTMPPSSTTTSTPSSSTTTSTKIDTKPPTGTILIDQGAVTADCQLVTLYLSAEDTGSGMGDGAQMMFSKHEKKHWSDPMPFEPTKSWTLSPGKGERMVYVKFSDAAGNWMEEPVSDSIMLNSSCKESSTLSASSFASSSGFLSTPSGINPLKAGAHAEWLSPLRLFQREEYIIIDLGKPKVVTRVDLASNRFLSFDLFPQDFEIQASADKENWVTLFTVENYASPPSCLESWTFEEIETRYIRMHITRIKPFLFFFYSTYVKDIAVYGCANSQIVNPEVYSSSGPGQAEALEMEGSFILQGTDDKECAHSHQPVDSTDTNLNGSGKTVLLHDGSSRTHMYETSDIICDNGGPSTSFNGIWDMINEDDCYETSSLIAEKSATYTWRPDILRPGSYAVSMWWSSGTDNCSSCPVDITCNGELQDTLYTDQRQGGGRWNQLGTYELKAGNECSVTITSEGPGFKTCADAVRFVYLGESSPETQIDFIHPNPALLDEEICFSGHVIPVNQMSIRGYSWVSQLDGEIGTTESFCTSSLSEGIHHISFKIQDDEGLWSAPAEKTVSIVNMFTPSQSVWLEAEEGTLNWPMETGWNDNASNGEYAWVPHESGTVVTPEEDGGYAEYSFELSEEGNFVVWGRVLSQGIGNDSFWISMDNSTYILWDTPSGNKGNWEWDRVSNRGGPDPVVYHLDAGTHTLVIKSREDGAKIDRILITNDIGYKPAGQGN